MARQVLTDPIERSAMLIRVLDDLRRAQDDRSEWLRDKETWMLLYNNVPPDTSPRYPGEPNFVVPVVMTTKETLHSRILNALTGLDELAQGKSYGSISREKMKKITDFMDWELQVEMDFVNVLDDWIGDILIYGVSPLWVRWDRRVRRDKRIESFPAEAPPMYPAMKEVFQELKIPIKEGSVSDEDYINVFFDDPTIVPLGDGNFDVTHVEDGETKEVEVYIDRSRAEEDGTVDVEILEEVTIYDAPKATIVNVEDFIVPPGYPDVQDAPYIFHRRYMTYDQIARMVDRGLFDIDLDTMVTLKEFAEHRDASVPSRGQEDDIRQSRADVDGVESQNMRRDEFEVIDAYYRWDIDNDGFEEEVVFTIIPEHRVWCSGQYLTVTHPHGKRPFICGRMIPRTNQWEGIGIPELVAPFQEELSAMFNAKLRKDDFTGMPWGTYKPSSGIKARNIKIAPGVFFPSDNPAQDLHVVQLSPQSITDVGNINLLTQFLERLTGVSDLSSGTFGSRPNAPRTFGATAAIIQEGNVRFDTYIKRLKRSMADFLWMVHSLNSVLMEKSKKFYVVGDDSPATIDRDTLRGQYQYSLMTNTQNTNKAVMRDFATFVYQNLMANPLIANNVGAMYRLAKLFAESHEIKDFKSILPEPPEAQQRPPMDQMEEIATMASGEYIDILPTDNHKDHVEQMMLFMESPMLDKFPREFVPYLMLHLQKHNDALQLAQGAQGAGTQQVGGVQGGLAGSEGFQGGEQAPSPNAGSTNINNAPAAQ